MSKKLTYDGAMAELQAIVAEIEDEEISIDDLSVKVKRAAELLQYCQQKLRQTEDDVNKVLSQLNEA
jgi:exodeoxyribonuclease VII small subunit